MIVIDLSISQKRPLGYLRNYIFYNKTVLVITFVLFFLIIFRVPVLADNPPNELTFFTTSPSQLIFDECQPDLSYNASFSIEMINPDSQWALYVFLKPIDKKIKFPENFYILSSSSHQESILVPNEPFLLIEGTQPVLVQSRVGEFALRFKSDWSIPAGQYQFELLFAYQNDFKQSPLPLPYKIPVQVTIEPAVLLDLTVQPQPNLTFFVQEQPGFHISESQVTLAGKSNVESLSIICWIDDLKGKKGQTIPSSRVYLSRPKGLKKTELVPLDKPLEIMSYEFGEPISLTINGFVIETNLDDLPDEYEGQIHFDYLIPVIKNKK